MDSVLRIAMYSHDTFGLGHLTRTLRLATSIREAFPRSNVLIISGTPVPHLFRFPAGVELVKLPSVVKKGPEEYEGRDLDMTFEGIRTMRASLIREAVRGFGPDLFLVDNVPLGMKSEIVPTLRYLRSSRPTTRIHLVLRDILDDPSRVRSFWDEQGIDAVLAEFYDEIHVFGSPVVFDTISEYGLPRDKSNYMGYITPSPVRHEGLTVPQDRKGRARILATVGGGGDGAPILREISALQRRRNKRSRLRFRVVLGPLMGKEDLAALEEEYRSVRGIRFRGFHPALCRKMRKSDLVVSMGGYNSVCELLSCARRALVIPRVHPRREQEIRARCLERLGLIQVLLPQHLTAHGLGAALDAALARDEFTAASNGVPLDGRDRFVARLRDLFAAGPDPHPVSASRVPNP